LKKWYLGRRRGRQPDTAAHRELEDDVEVLEDFVLLDQVPEEWLGIARQQCVAE